METGRRRFSRMTFLEILLGSVLVVRPLGEAARVFAGRPEERRAHKQTGHTHRHQKRQVCDRAELVDERRDDGAGPRQHQQTQDHRHPQDGHAFRRRAANGRERRIDLLRLRDDTNGTRTAHVHAVTPFPHT